MNDVSKMRRATLKSSTKKSYKEAYFRAFGNRHKVLSYVKSGMRIIGFPLLIVDMGIGVLVLVGAELVGIAEEGGEW